MWVNLTQSLEGTTVKGGVDCHSSLELGCPSSHDLRRGSSWFSGLQTLGTPLTHHFSGLCTQTELFFWLSFFSSLQTVDLRTFCLPWWREPIPKTYLLICVSIYVFYLFRFSGEPWLKHTVICTDNPKQYGKISVKPPKVERSLILLLIVKQRKLYLETSVESVKRGKKMEKMTLIEIKVSGLHIA